MCWLRPLEVSQHSTLIDSSCPTSEASLSTHQSSPTVRLALSKAQDLTGAHATCVLALIEHARRDCGTTPALVDALQATCLRPSLLEVIRLLVQIDATTLRKLQFDPAASALFNEYIYLDFAEEVFSLSTMTAVVHGLANTEAKLRGWRGLGCTEATLDILADGPRFAKLLRTMPIGGSSADRVSLHRRHQRFAGKMSIALGVMSNLADSNAILFQLQLSATGAKFQVPTPV
jgi:hypothetical protein